MMLRWIALPLLVSTAVLAQTTPAASTPAPEGSGQTTTTQSTQAWP